MTNTQPEAEREIQSELEEFIARFERLSISPAPRPPNQYSPCSYLPSLWFREYSWVGFSGKGSCWDFIFPFALFYFYHLKTSSSDSLIHCHMISSDCEPFSPSEYSVEGEPLIDYNLPPWTHPQCFDHSRISPLQCGHHHGQRIYWIPPFPHPSFPSHHDLVAFARYNIINNDCDREFLIVMFHCTIVYLEGKLDTSRLVYNASRRASFYLKWRSYFPTSRSLHPPCNCIRISFRISYTSNHTSMHMFIDMIICWLHCLYDYTYY